MPILCLRASERGRGGRVIYVAVTERRTMVNHVFIGYARLRPSRGGLVTMTNDRRWREPVGLHRCNLGAAPSSRP